VAAVIRDKRTHSKTHRKRRETVMKHAIHRVFALAGCFAMIGSMTLFPSQEADANADKYLRHVQCNEHWRASPAVKIQGCKLHRVNWDRFLWSMRTEWRITSPHNDHLEKQMEHSLCYIDVYCDWGLPEDRATWKGLIKPSDLKRMARCKNDVKTMKPGCEQAGFQDLFAEYWEDLVGAFWGLQPGQ